MLADWQRLTPVPALLSEAVVPDPTATVPLCPAVTTSRRELPVTAPFPTRRPLPFTAATVPAVPIFSFVLDASDLESSGWGLLDLAGGILSDSADGKGWSIRSLVGAGMELCRCVVQLRISWSIIVACVSRER